MTFSKRSSFLALKENPRIAVAVPRVPHVM